MTVLNNIQLAVTLTKETLYRIQFDISAYTSGGIGINLGWTNYSDITEAVDTFVCYVIAGNADFMRFYSSSFVGSLDNISIKKCL